MYTLHINMVMFMHNHPSNELNLFSFLVLFPFRNSFRCYDMTWGYILFLSQESKLVSDNAAAHDGWYQRVGGLRWKISEKWDHISINFRKTPTWAHIFKIQSFKFCNRSTVYMPMLLHSKQYLIKRMTKIQIANSK